MASSMPWLLLLCFRSHLMLCLFMSAALSRRPSTRATISVMSSVRTSYWSHSLYASTTTAMAASCGSSYLLTCNQHTCNGSQLACQIEMFKDRNFDLVHLAIWSLTVANCWLSSAFQSIDVHQEDNLQYSLTMSTTV